MSSTARLKKSVKIHGKSDGNIASYNFAIMLQLLYEYICLLPAFDEEYKPNAISLMRRMYIVGFDQ